MTRREDPVDSALEMLRADEWSAENCSPDLENRVMQQFNNRPPASRFGHSRSILLALAFVAIGGVTFAAAGGVGALQRWLVRIEIDGQVTEVTLDENGEHTFTVDTEDGGTATVHIQQSTSPDGETTRIAIQATGDGTDEREVCKVIRKVRKGLPESTFSLDDLGDAEPLAEWTNQAGDDNELYILSAEEGSGSRIFFVTYPEGGDPEVRLVGSPSIQLVGEGLDTQVQVSDNGTVSIAVNDGSDEVCQLKLRIAMGDIADEMPQNIRVQTSDGAIKVQVAPIDDEL
ncbi:MAG: hypothetical protein IID37_12240 [Planctomycetes bacterium]|nr:hypothetical protein [Planctomycetota bacterium]